MAKLKSEVKISVEAGDLLSYPSDVLALKYSQFLYPLDLEIIRRFDNIGINLRRNLPKETDYYFCKSQQVTGANSIIFVGVEGRLDYKQLRSFCYRAITLLANEGAEASRLSLTHYGVAYGLDETESFKSEVAGLIDGITSGNCPRQLKYITFVVKDINKAQRLDKVLLSLLPSGMVNVGKDSITEKAESASMIGELQTAGYTSADKPHIFVAMPFADDMEDVFHYGIQGAVNAAGFLCERADLSSFTGEIMAWVRERIDSSHLVIADLSTANPNVYLEVGYAWGRHISTVLLVRDPADLRFDVRGHRCLVYKSIKNLEELLSKELKHLKESIKH